MIRNEIRLFFSKKNILTFLGAILLMLCIYQFQYIREYKEAYNVDRATAYSYIAQDSNLICTKHMRELAYLEVKEPESSEIEKEKKLVSIWQFHSSASTLLTDYWEHWTSREDDIRAMEKKMDEQLLDAPEDIELGEDLLYRPAKRMWNHRMLLREAYENAGRKLPLNEKVPDGSYVVSQSLGGLTAGFLVLVLMLLIWNYDIWSADFDEHTDRQLYILPVRRGKLFWNRFLVHWFFSILGVLLLLAVLFLRGTVSYGTGLERFEIVNMDALEHFGTLNFDAAEVNPADAVMPVGTLLLYRVGMMVCFLTFFLVVVQLVSYAWKSGMSTIITMAVLMLVIITTSMLGNVVEGNAGVGSWQRYVPFFYFQTEKIFSGELGIGVRSALLGSAMMMIVCLTGTKVWMKHREIV